MFADLQNMHWFISIFVCVRPRDIYDILVDESGVLMIPVLYFLLHMRYVHDIQYLYYLLWMFIVSRMPKRFQYITVNHNL